MASFSRRSESIFASLAPLRNEIHRDPVRSTLKNSGTSLMTTRFGMIRRPLEQVHARPPLDGCLKRRAGLHLS